LIFFSYLTNQWLVGIMVLLCHDASDFFLIMARGYKVIFILLRIIKIIQKKYFKLSIFLQYLLGLGEDSLYSQPVVFILLSLVQVQ